MAKATTNAIEVLHQAVQEKGIIIKIIKFKGKVFKMVYECTNGTSRVITLLMTADGQFAHVLSHVELGDEFKFVASFVSDISKKRTDAVKAFGMFEKLIEKIY